jgi:hypothetical protein
MWHAILIVSAFRMAILLLCFLAFPALVSSVDGGLQTMTHLIQLQMPA